MIADHLIVPECIIRPGSFTGLMTLYESNYLKLRQLLGDQLADLHDAVSGSEHDCDLHLNVHSRDRYTTTFRLTYLFDSQPGDPSDTGQIADPDLTLKAYHDARLLEAVSLAAFHRHHKLRELARYHVAELDRRWQRNMMLNKWLDYLIDTGHSFT
ncbi:MAG: DUF1249 domain-containing protein [Gammaproteobacteria bacterium]|jgi:hypothetical protein